MEKYRFGEFELDLDALQLTRAGEPVRLERRPFDLLAYLVRHRERMVTRQELISTLWSPRVIVDFESGLNTLVRKVRNALGDDAEAPGYIETVPGRGYRFIAPVETGPVTADAAAKPPWRWRIRLGLLLLAVVATFTWFWSAREPESIRIAVLPFENLSGDASMDYLASGLAEETNSSLARIELPDVRVIGLVSAKAAAESGLSPDQVARQLDADYLVLSTLRLDGGQIRVSSRLVRMPDDEQVWSASFDRRLTNLFSLQSELSIAIAEQIRQRLSPNVAEAIDRRRASNPEAYDLYLRGRHAWTALSPYSLRRSLIYYQQAAELDPHYALAWAGIVHTLSTGVVTADLQPKAVKGLAYRALERALVGGADLAEVQYALATYYTFVENDPRRAEAAARQAISLDPNSAIAHMVLGVILPGTGNYVEAVEMMRRARELDPLFALTFANSANVALMGGDIDSALEFARQAVAISAEGWVGYLHLGRAEHRLGKLEAALDAFASAERNSGGNSKAVAWRAYVLCELGRVDEARTILEELQALAAERYVPPHAFAVIHAALGEQDAALDALEQGIAEHDIHLSGIGFDYRFAALEGNPRFESVLRAWEGLPETADPAPDKPGPN